MADRLATTRRMGDVHEEALIVRVPLSGPNAFEGIADLEDRLIEAIATAGAGEFDGNEVAQDELVLYMYGPSAEALFGSVEEALRASSLMRRAVVTLRRGAPGSPSRDVFFE